MRQRVRYLLRNKLNTFNGLNKLALASFIALFICILFLLTSKPTTHSNTYATSTRIPVTAVLTSTKWWIKTAHPKITTTLKSTEVSVIDCPLDISSDLQPGVYAYISLEPAVPNRIRSGAGIAYSYIGQIEPGEGVKVIDGPLCADDLSWWLVESNDAGLKGWTATGSRSEQWIIPCADPYTTCSRVLTNPSPSTMTIQDNAYNPCKSYMFTIGTFAQVKQSELLVIRSEPYTGTVIGYTGPGSKVKIIDGPSCAGNTIWWKVNILTPKNTGWTTETNLTPCSKEECP